MAKEVFISYHGGQGDENKSSYKKAEELYNFLETRGISCFLFRKTNNEDFYDAINQGILECNHFILVACNKDMLSEWVRDEVKQFDGLRKNGKKSDCVISAYIYGSITEEDLYNFNTLFSTKDIMRGEQGFEKIYQQILNKKRNSKSSRSNTDFLDSNTSFDDISLNFLNNKFKRYKDINEEEYLSHCLLITKRLRCMAKTTISPTCTNIINDLFNRIIQCKSPYIYKISGPAGTQKSYILQLLYICLKRNSSCHNFSPIYLHCEKIRNILELENLTADVYLNNLFKNITVDNGSEPLFIIDGVLNVNADDYKLDYAIKKIIDSFSQSHIILGVNQVYCDNGTRLNRSSLIRGNYENNLNLSLISLHDKDKCLEYITTIEDLPIDSQEQVYELLNKSGLLTINEEIIRIVCSYYDGTSVPNIMDIFESEILEYFYGSTDDVKVGAAKIFEFAYGVAEIDFSDKIIAKMIKLICKESVYLNCLIAIHYLSNLEKYEITRDLSFFQMIFPKDITRFITARIHTVPKYEAILLDLGKHYNELNAMGQSEMSFFLGRIYNTNYRKTAIELLNQYYNETTQLITQKIIDDKYNGIKYLRDEYKQDLFLLRGLSVSLIYCGDQTVLNEYIRSLIDNDLSNSINRGFHLEYYGDKRYLPNQNMLDYEDNPRLGERTLRILCNSVSNQLNSDNEHPSLLLELFTIVSLLQVRIETDKKIISFNLQPFLSKAKQLIIQYVNKVEDNVINAFFKMALEDFGKYTEKPTNIFSPECDLCNEYLIAPDVKRAGWIMQNINDPESIVEHMYACWFIGLIFLPNDDDPINGYNKQKILNMLLVHDLAETKLSDIPKYEKINHPGYEQKENEVMLSILLKGTYQNIGALTPFVDAWDAWYKMDEENAKIAKDIDVIQAIYQFLIYNIREPKKFSEERRTNWIKEILTVKTVIGKSILNKLILQNELFKNTLSKYNQILENKFNKI